MSLTRRRTVAALAALAAGPILAPEARSQEGEMAGDLIEAVNSGDVARLSAALAEGAALEPRDSAGRTPLLLATRANHVEIARLLIAAGADVNAKDSIRDTPFLYAGAEGRNDILRLILSTGKAKLDDTNRYGGNALIPAAHHGHPETVRILIDAGLDIDHVNNLGWTALLEAVILGDGGPTYQEIVGILLDAGADAEIADRDGTSPLEHARRMGYGAIADLIEAQARK
jgi:ankyrin repeat protein